MMKLLYVANDNLIRLEGLKNAKSGGGFLNSATVQVTLNDSSGQPVSGQTWPLTLSYVTGSDGNYEATLEDTIDVNHGDYLTAVITAEETGLKARWELPVRAITRTD